MSIKWGEWGKAAFARARNEKKPILLAIGASWCHWCHTMDELTYGDENIADFISEKFTPVKVDTDQRPDINERYNVGGWPSTLVLANDGEPVSAATYIPPGAMVSFLDDALARFKKYKSKKKKAKEPRQVKYDALAFHELVKSFYDPANKGFGLEPKFLHPDILEYLLVKNDAQSQKMLNETLLAMAKSEVFDQYGGGFFRYATQRNWTFPHFEKLLEDNARMLQIYVQVYEKNKRKEFLEVINRILFFLLTILYDVPRGVFYASQTADEEFCKLNWDERAKEEPPFVNETIYTNANAIAAKALLVVSRNEKEYESLALKTLDFLWKHLRGGVPHNPESANPIYLLKDAVCLLDAFVTAFHTTNRLEWKSRAETVAKHLESFYDKKHGGFFDIFVSKDSVGRLKERKKPVEENAVAAIALHKLSKMTQNEKYKLMAQKSLDAVSADAFALGVYAAKYANAREQVE